MGWTQNTDGTLTITDDATSGGGPAEDMQKIHDVAISRGGGVASGTKAAREALTASQSAKIRLYIEEDTGNVYERRTDASWAYVAGTDTGWVACTRFDENWSVNAVGGYAALSVRRLGKRVSLRGVMRWNSTQSTSPGFQGAVVPPDFRPPVRSPLSVFAQSLIEVSLAANGEIALGVGNHTPGPRDFVLSGEWWVD